MNLISKGAPPPALVTYGKRLDTWGDPPRPAQYDGPDFEAVKQDVREALVERQRGVCCYCTDRIAPDSKSMKIEHRVPQASDPSRDLDWTNLFGACPGEVRTAQGANTLYCDSSKGERPITLDPSEPSHIAALGYENSGRLTSTRPQHQTEIDGVLCLNNDTLRERRKKALAAVQRELSARYPKGNYPAGPLERYRDELRSPAGQLRPYSGFLVWWLERAIRRAATT